MSNELNLIAHSSFQKHTIDTCCTNVKHFKRRSTTQKYCRRRMHACNAALPLSKVVPLFDTYLHLNIPTLATDPRLDTLSCTIHSNKKKPTTTTTYL